jgi:hypothetical protein
MLVNNDLQNMIGSLIKGLDSFGSKTDRRYSREVNIAMNTINAIIQKSRREQDLVNQIYSYGSLGIKIQPFLTKTYTGDYDSTIVALTSAVDICKSIAKFKYDNYTILNDNPSLLGLANDPTTFSKAQLAVSRLKATKK